MGFPSLSIKFLSISNFSSIWPTLSTFRFYAGKLLALEILELPSDLALKSFSKFFIPG